ncbi:cytochrome C oxidase subunit II [Metabacillus fastidiosus]|nr:cytochrome c oxidase subunit II [Metabacillus fastidiosus]
MKDSNLKGTLVSVFVIGIIICIMWFSAYAFYLSR